MLDKNTLVKVTNRSYGVVVYNVPDLGIRREYQPNETKEVEFNEVLKLSYSSGGKRLIEQYLIIDNKKAVEEILGEVVPEYFYTESEVKKLLEEGSLEQLKDCLDFAEAGVISLVQKMAVDLEINDVSKRKAIFEKTGYNVDSAIAVNQAEKAKDEEKNAAPADKPTKRRSTPIKSSKYTIVTEEKE